MADLAMQMNETFSWDRATLEQANLILGKDVDQSPTPKDVYRSFSYEKETSMPVLSLGAPIISGQTVAVKDISISKEAVCEMGFPEVVVQVAIDIQRLDHGTDFADAAQLFTAVEDLYQNPEKQAQAIMRLHQAEQAKKEKAELKRVPKTKEQLRERVKKLAQENLKLRQRKMCRECKKVELSSSGVTFLPCGHFITCETCSEKFDECPACGKSIMGTVRTFLS